MRAARFDGALQIGVGWAGVGVRERKTVCLIYILGEKKKRGRATRKHLHDSSPKKGEGNSLTASRAVPSLLVWSKALFLIAKSLQCHQAHQY